MILGVGGQDGSYLAELLLQQGYEVHGTVRRSSVDNLGRVRHLTTRLHRNTFVLHEADLTDFYSVLAACDAAGAHEVYNMADQDHVRWSRSTPRYSLDVTAGGCLNVIQASYNVNRDVRIFQPISSTVFGGAPTVTPQTVDTPLYPQSPYACAKACAWHMCRSVRRGGTWVACGVFYNHDSERRGPDYLLQRIARGEGLAGNLDTVVDVGYAPEYVEAAWKMLQHPEPLDLLIGTGWPYTIRSLLGSRAGRAPEPASRAAWLGPAEYKTPAVVPDTGPAERLIGWRARTDAAGVLERLVAHHSRRAGGEDTQTAGGPPPGLVAGT